ncbi:thioredoxin, partial [Listeria monocytogenes]|nr:thioredoxin [Listeria monocytogenes]
MYCYSKTLYLTTIQLWNILNVRWICMAIIFAKEDDLEEIISSHP